MVEPSGEFHSVVVLVDCLGATVAATKKGRADAASSSLDLPAGHRPGRHGPATAPGITKMHSGHQIYGWLSGELAQVERLLGVKIHGSGAVAVSPLLEPSRARLAPEVKEGGSYAFRLAFLESISYRAWCERIWPRLTGAGGVLRIGSHDFRASRCTEDPGEHLLADRRTVGELIRWGKRHAEDSLAMRFLTPATFKFPYRLPETVTLGRVERVHVEVPLPDPGRIVDNLARRWMALVPPETAIPAEILEIVRQTAALGRCNISTGVVELEPAVGPKPAVRLRCFAGEAELRCLAPLPAAKVVFAALCRFAAFAGVGSETASGMGLVQVHPKANAKRTGAPAQRQELAPSQPSVD